MSHTKKLIHSLKGLTNAFLRYPLTAAFLLAAAIFNGYNINSSTDKFQKIIMTLVVGAFLGIVAQVLYERYFNTNFSLRLILIGAGGLFTVGYYLIIRPASIHSIEVSIRTLVALFALFIAFIWIPAIRNSITFNETFMINFKSFFISIFFSGIIYAGISIILATVNELLFKIDSRLYLHAANIIFIIFAPMYLLSLIPVYSHDKRQEEEQSNIDEGFNHINRMEDCPKFLEILISYIIIPLVSVFTIILLIYMIRNIGKGFWSNNLLEPMIVVYSIIVIIVYILASRLNNRFAVLFRRIFPKVLVPLVLIQTISSILRIQDMGLTYNRYYVILFGIFATVAGILFSFIPVRKNGIIAALLIVFSVISIIPPIDAFTVSRVSHVNRLEDVLTRNNMLSNNKIVVNSSISEEDKQKIIQSMDYLNRMEYIKPLSWLPTNFSYYSDFNKTFGFNSNDNEKFQYVYLNLPENTPINISEYDYIIPGNIAINQNMMGDEVSNIDIAGNAYTLTKVTSKNQCSIILRDSNDKEMIRFDTKQIFDKFSNYNNNTKNVISLDEATFTQKNDLAAITLVIRNLNMENTSGNPYYGADVYILVNIY